MAEVVHCIHCDHGIPMDDWNDDKNVLTAQEYSEDDGLGLAECSFCEHENDCLNSQKDGGWCYE